MKLALAFGRPLSEIQRDMSSREFSEWIAYYNLEPFGSNVEDLRHAQLMALLANANRDAKKRKKPYKIDDFLLGEFEEPETREDDLRDKIWGIFGKLGARRPEELD